MAQCNYKGPYGRTTKVLKEGHHQKDRRCDNESRKWRGTLEVEEETSLCNAGGL